MKNIKDYFQDIAMMKINAFVILIADLCMFSISKSSIEKLNEILQLTVNSLQLIIAIISLIILVRGKLTDLFKKPLSKE